MANASILVVGGGMSGLTAAIEAAEVGREVYIVEKDPYLGGRVAQMNQYFPKLCPPNCGLEMNFRRIKSNPKIHCLTLAEVTDITGQEGDFQVRVRLQPRYVKDDCTACGRCTEVCPAERENSFNYGLDKTKAVYLPHCFAFPMKYVLDTSACKGAECARCANACPVEAIDLSMQPKDMTLRVGSIVWATGWKPYDATNIAYYGSGKFQNVITNVIMERLAASGGPTGGKITRPSDGKLPERVAFIQCAGSRDVNYLPYCSGVCCMASLKQATYVIERNPAARVDIYFIDIRALGKFEDFYTKIRSNTSIHLIKGKVGNINEDPETKDLFLTAEDQTSQHLMNERYDLVVLATGMAPVTGEIKASAGLAYDANGFIAGGEPGIYSAGCVGRPMDVASCIVDATAAALKAVQSSMGRLG